MKITIKRPDGTVIEFEGRREELRPIEPLRVGPYAPIQLIPLPCVRPHRDDWRSPFVTWCSTRDASIPIDQLFALNKAGADE